MVFNKKNTFTICVWRVWIVIRYFLFEKLAFNGLLMVIGMQILLLSIYARLLDGGYQIVDSRLRVYYETL